MDLILQDFNTDLGRVRKLLEFIQLQEVFAAGQQSRSHESDEFTATAIKIMTTAQESRADFRIFVGTLILYLGGRFENYVRSQFELLCENLATRCNSYDRLPKEMRSSLVTMTAKVMESPRKYGHAEKGVERFVKNLATNLSDRSTLSIVNVECLSITHENLRPDVMADLFGRIGVKKIWTTIGEQAAVKTHFETDDNAKCAKECESLLNQFMDDRNNIAHPSVNVNWPNDTRVSKYINYFEVVARALSEIMTNLSITIPAKQLAAASTPPIVPPLITPGISTAAAATVAAPPAELPVSSTSANVQTISQPTTD